MAESDLGQFLEPTQTVDSSHERIVAFAEETTCGVSKASERAALLYQAVRDGVRYDPYNILISVSALRASSTLAAGRGWCVPKAILLAACCRAIGIPARLGFADVRNHLSTERLRRAMGTDVFYWHGYTSMLLDGHWRKATPAFNRELCERFRLRTLEFDGHADALLQPADLDGKRHMEYLRFRGEFADVPLDAMVASLRRHYPNLAEKIIKASFEADVVRETGQVGAPGHGR